MNKISAKNCGDPSSNLSINGYILQNGPSFLGPSTEGASWNVLCSKGSSWQDGSPFKIMTCNSAGNWNFPLATTCAGI